MLEEDEDTQLAHQMQNDLYSNKPGEGNSRAAPNNSRRHAPGSMARDHQPIHHERLIGGDARSDFYDAWGMDEHEVAQHYGGGMTPGMDVDDDYQKVIEASLRENRASGISLEEE